MVVVVLVVLAVLFVLFEFVELRVEFVVDEFETVLLLVEFYVVLVDDLVTVLFVLFVLF